jgi:transcription elongation factor GreB
MSKAFVREDDTADGGELEPVTSVLPEGVPNYMTAAGAERLRDQLQQLVEQDRPKLVTEAKDDASAKRRLAVLDQRIVRLQQSLETARIVSHAPDSAPRVTFGATVTVRDRAGTESEYRIVGVDETELEPANISWVSPIARALMNHRVREQVSLELPGGGHQTLEIVAIIYE